MMNKQVKLILKILFFFAGFEKFTSANLRRDRPQGSKTIDCYWFLSILIEVNFSTFVGHVSETSIKFQLKLLSA